MAESEAVQELRKTVDKGKKLIAVHARKSELEKVRDDLENHFVPVSKELRDRAEPLEVKAPNMLDTKVKVVSAARLEQQADIEVLCELVEQVRRVKERLHMALQTAR
jgi:hypothetical protein